MSSVVAARREASVPGSCGILAGEYETIALNVTRKVSSFSDFEFTLQTSDLSASCETW